MGTEEQILSGKNNFLKFKERVENEQNNSMTLF